mmetsp:Transcript_72612/g.212824  ORF Transcript_72612/g.212824 Transcript_72612/m.212824 type:complete len:241 (+) Transcript_72612:736-1458(+)
MIQRDHDCRQGLLTRRQAGSGRNKLLRIGVEQWLGLWRSRDPVIIEQEVQDATSVVPMDRGKAAASRRARRVLEGGDGRDGPARGGKAVLPGGWNLINGSVSPWARTVSALHDSGSSEGRRALHICGLVKSVSMASHVSQPVAALVLPELSGGHGARGAGSERGEPARVRSLGGGGVATAVESLGASKSPAVRSVSIVELHEALAMRGVGSLVVLVAMPALLLFRRKVGPFCSRTELGIY